MRLELEAGADLDSAGNVDLSSVYAKGGRAVQAKAARESEVVVVERVQEIRRQHHLVAFRHRNILGDGKVNVPLDGCTQLVEGNLPVLAQQGAAHCLVDRVRIAEEVDTAGRCTYAVTPQDASMPASAEAAQLKALGGNGASTAAEPTQSTVVAIGRYA